MGEEWVNNLNRTAILNVLQKMQEDPEFGKGGTVSFDATWKKGVVTEPSGRLVCYPPPELQLGEDKKGPSIYSYCPLVSGGCFSFILMMRAAHKNYHFQTMGTTTRTDADFMGFYQNKWADNMEGWHPWVNGIKVEMLVQTDHSQKELDNLAVEAEKFCPSSEIMRREFPVDINRFEFSPVITDKTLNVWDNVPCYYNMDKYKEIANSGETEYFVKQHANMFWHCQNESETHPDSLMTFHFPHDSDSKIVMSFDQPISSGKYASPVAGCFFGGLSTLLHTIAARIYAHGYLVQEIKGTISAKINKRKVFGVDEFEYIFPVGAAIGIHIITNAPDSMVDEILFEAENMSPTMMNWKHSLPLNFEIYREKVRIQRSPSAAESVVSTDDSSVGSEGLTTKRGRKRTLFTFMKGVLRRGGWKKDAA